MSETKVKPTFKPKFSAPVSTSRPTPTLENIPKGKTVKKHNENKVARISSTTEKSKTKSESEVCDPAESETKDKSEKRTSLTDSQYDNIFTSVTARVMAVDFLDLDDRFAGSQDFVQTDERAKSKTDKKKKRKRKRDKDATKKTGSDEQPSIQNDESTSKKAKGHVVESFRESILKKSPNSSKLINEVTPTLSPSDVSDKKLLLKKPERKRKEKKKEAKIAGKRKSLKFSGKVKANIDEVMRAKIRDAEESACGKGIWVQCSPCDKWRFLADCHDPASLPEDWSCSLNPNKEFSSCSSPEETWTESSQDDFVYTKFTPGSIVWAKMVGYPSWPAMVDYEPDFTTFYETFPDGNVSYYHVVFLDDLVSRAWISHRNIEAYRVNETPIKLPREGKRTGFVKDLESAKQRAQKALKMAIPDRLVKFAFQSRFQGKSHWSRDKGTVERKMKKKARESGRKIRPEARSHAPEKIYEKRESSDKNVKEEINDSIRDSSHVSVSEEEACVNEEADESPLFGNMVIDEAHDQSDEIPLVLTENDEITKPMNLDLDIFTMELGKSKDEENCKPIDLSQKAVECDKNDHQGNDEPLNSSGKMTSKDRLPGAKDDEYWLAPENPGITSESLFEDVDMQVEEEELQQPANVAEWDDFEKMVMEG